VCARCVGLYAGGAFGSIAGAAACGRRALGRLRLPLMQVNWIATAAAAIPTLVTFSLEWGLGWPVSNTVRAVAALPLGAVVAFIVVSALPTLHS
jgi:hypothetical protein